VQLQRAAAAPTLMIVDRPSLKLGSQASRVRLIGDNFPALVTPADLHFGPGVTVRSIVSHTKGEIVVTVDVAATAPLGRRDVAVKNSKLPGATAIYDRVDYVRVTPQSAMASFSDAAHPLGYRQFEATGFQNGPDGKPHTADDLELGPVDVAWSAEVFHAPPGSKADFVGTISPSGLFSPGTENPHSNFDVWVVATARDAKDQKGVPLTDKCYMVVTVPTYIFNGRKYVRDLDRWVDDGSASADR
jgi:quinohemoprotein amine dehydrogenase